MQQDQFEVLFCDLCGTSVPLADLEKGAAIRHHAKTIGGCCLQVLRKGDSPLASPGAPPAPAAPPRAAAGDGRLLPVAIVLLAAVAAATVFLDQRVGGVESLVRQNQEQSVQAQRSDSDVLQGLGVAMDSVARKADLDALTERLANLDGAMQLHQEQLRLQVEGLRQVVVAVQQETHKLVAGTIDYRPLFEDHRQQLHRLLTAVADLRGAGAAAPSPAAPAAPPAAVPEATGLPEALLAHVKKLGDADAAVRFEAVDALVASKNPAVLKYLLPMARDADSFVRRLTIEGLRDFKHVEAVDALIAALGDSDVSVAETAWSSLKKLTGQKIPFDATSTSKEVRQRAQQKWQEWWDKNRATFGS
ncbi:MAG: HEAT repeat domain-containing protein [Planctomycetes bacterium]|nr:HEAT repeat domain-containing protein [Planctomycetota bacterium]